MIASLLWYLVVSLLGLLAFPIAYRLLPGLPERGYAFARSLGLLLWGFAFWLLGSYGVVANNPAGLLLALILLAGAAYWAGRGLPPGGIRRWLRESRSYILRVEMLFLLAFAAMALLRATHPEAQYTEKPMELAFINSIHSSPDMPPNDPWLSGYSISYYYFGYLMVSMLSMASGVSGAVGFNLGVALVFALGALGAYGLAYNLLAFRNPLKRTQNAWLAGLAPVFVLLFGNLEGLLEVLHARHLFWEVGPDGAMQSPFWAWLDIKDLVFPPPETASWTPRFYGAGFHGHRWWWWRASRVINDTNFAGGEQELIDEFPAFSFTLGDLHPHVLSLGFVFLAIALALNLYRGAGEEKDGATFMGSHISPPFFALSLIVLGGLAFLNIWDFPIYIVLFAAVYAFRRAEVAGWAWSRFGDFMNLALLIGVGGVLLYLPFFMGFSSQAGGILPNLLNPTRGAHLWVMFGTLFPFLFVYLLYQRSAGWGRRLMKGLLAAVALVAALWLFHLAFTYLLAIWLDQTPLGSFILNNLGAPDLASLLQEAGDRRWAAIGGLVTLALLLGLVLSRLWPRSNKQADKKAAQHHSHGFVLILILVGTLLILAPEFVYLRDHFGTRMNTVFKLYYQAWVMLGVAAAYGAAVLLLELRRAAAWLFTLFFVFLLALGLLYPVFAFSDVAQRPAGQPLGLDGSRHLSEGERGAVEWLNRAPLGVLVEAVGGQYSDFARYATHSAQVGVLGWPGHEGQWRGGSVNYSPRITDIEILYTTAEWPVAEEILQKYAIDYVVLGVLERGAYTVNAEKFDEHLQLAYQNPEVTIYRVP